MILKHENLAEKNLAYYNKYSIDIRLCYKINRNIPKRPNIITKDFQNQSGQCVLPASFRHNMHTKSYDFEVSKPSPW